jgi:hypothetical protein
MHPTEMTREQRLFLIKMNNRLTEIGKLVKKEGLEIIDMMDINLTLQHHLELPGKEAT